MNSSAEAPETKQQKKRQIPWAVSVFLSSIVLAFTFGKGIVPKVNSRTEASLVVFGGLMSSSCCLIQLLLNAVSVGCAGFSALGILRPLSLSVSFGYLGARSFLEHRTGIKKPRPWSWGAALVLSFLPEIIHMANRLALMKRSSKLLSEGSITTTMIVEGVACEACAASFRSDLNSSLRELHGPTCIVAVEWESPKRTLVTSTFESNRIESTGRSSDELIRGVCKLRQYTVQTQYLN
jgi:hypothetical protein